MKKDKLNILLCDITYDTTALANEVFPLNIGLVGSFLVKELGKNINVTLSKFIVEIEDYILKNKYDVIAFSNYPWNLMAGVQLSRMAKKINPSTLTIFGGPNFPYDANEQLTFLKKYNVIDAYVFNGGELPFANFVNFIKDIDEKNRRELIKNSNLPGIVAITSENKIAYGGPLQEQKDLDFIPSPYLTGLLDKFFLDRRLSPMIQTNRGCPFTCAFCADGHKSQSKVKLFSMERVKKELDYISERIDPKLQKTLFITDLNFGMLPRDIEIAEMIYDIYKKTNFNFPTYIHATTGKNSRERVIAATEKLAGNLQLSMAMQSTDETVLKNVKRQNIRLEDYTALIPTLKANHQVTYGEIILGLPGETLSSHLKTIHDLMLMKVDTVTPHQFMMLNGAELNTQYSREKFGFKTKFRVLTRDFAKINSNYVVESEEILVATNSLSFAEYLYARKVHFMLGMINNPGLSIIMNLILDLKLNPVDLLTYIVDCKEKNKTTFECKKKLDYFIKDTEDELFDTEQEMQDYFSKKENFNKLLDGTEGKNLLQTHISGWVASDQVDLIIDMTLLWFKEKKVSHLKKVKDVIKFVRGKSTNIFSKYRMADIIKHTFDYDILEWSKNPDKPLDDFILPTSIDLEFIVTKELYEELERSLDIYGRTSQGIAKAYIRLGPQSVWRRVFKNNYELEQKSYATQPSSKLSSSSMSH